MTVHLPLSMEAQPDERSCGPTCLQAVYRYFGDEEPLDALIEEVPQLDSGGTLAVQLGCHALRRGYDVEIFTYNLQLFDPTWFADNGVDLADRLRRQHEAKVDDGRLASATKTYLEFITLGGQIRSEVLNLQLIYRLISERVPVLTGLSATYLYDAPREIAELDEIDDIRGEPVGHFVVLCGADRAQATVDVADPWPTEGGGQRRVLPFDRVANAIMLGVLTYDANLMVIRRRRSSSTTHR